MTGLHTGKILKQDGSFVLFDGFANLRRGDEIIIDKFPEETWIVDCDPYYDKNVLAILMHPKARFDGVLDHAETVTS